MATPGRPLSRRGYQGSLSILNPVSSHEADSVTTAISICHGKKEMLGTRPKMKETVPVGPEWPPRQNPLKGRKQKNMLLLCSLSSDDMR